MSNSTIEMIKKGDWMRGLSDDALLRIYDYYERNFGSSRREIYKECPHCGKKTQVEAEAYQIDSLVASVYYDEDDKQAYIDWDNAYIEADFNYVCDRCGTDMGIYSLDELTHYAKNNPDSAKED